MQVPDAYTVRRAAPDDAERIRIVHEAGWRVGYAHLYNPDVLERAVAQHCSRWPRVIGSPLFGQTTLLVLEHEEEVVGFAHFGPSGNELSTEQRPGLTEVYSFYIHPEHWGTSAASSLMERVVENVKARGENELYLSAGVDVPRARRFYEKMGFIENGQTNVYRLLDEVPTAELQYVLKIRGR